MSLPFFSWVLLALVCVFFLFYIKYVVRTLKKDLEILKVTNDLRNTLLNALPYPICLRGKDLKIIYFNDEFKRLSPLNTEDIPNKTLGFNDSEIGLAKQSLATKEAHSEEINTIINGDQYLYKFSAIPLLDKDAVVSIAHDITDKIQIKKELKSHIATQSCLLASIGTAIAIYDAEAKLIFFNQAFAKLWSLEERWLLSQPTYEDVLEKLREKRSIPEQINFSDFKKEQLHLLSTATSIHNDFLYLPNGRVLRRARIPHALGGALFSYKDITDKIILERSHKTLTKVQRETLNQLHDGITVFSESGTLEISNLKFVQMWHADSKRLEEKPHISEVLNMIHPMVTQSIKDKGTLKGLFLQNINLRKTKNIQLETNDDSIIEVLFVPLFNGATLISYHDMTDAMLVTKNLLERAHALKEANSNNTEFLSHISHELRTPLTSILGFSEALLNKSIGRFTEKQNAYIKDIHTASYYLMNFVHNILDLASVDVGDMNLHLSYFNTLYVAKSTIDVLQQKLERKNLMLRLEIDRSIENILGDANRIKQILFNLLNNAITHSPPREMIVFQIYKDNGNIIFCLKDSRKRLTKKCYGSALNNPYKITPESFLPKSETTLEMPLIKSFIELHGGSFEFSSKGAFKCILPLNNKALLAQYAKQLKEKSFSGVLTKPLYQTTIILTGGRQL